MTTRYLYRNQTTATVIGVSGIAPIGKKASFIFDSMIFIANKSKVDYTTKKKKLLMSDTTMLLETLN